MMKKVSFLLVCFLYSICIVNAQWIQKDVLHDNYREIHTSDITLIPGYDMYLTAVQNIESDNVDYFVNIVTDNHLSKNDILLFKLTNGEILKLTANSVSCTDTESIKNIRPTLNNILWGIDEYQVSTIYIQTATFRLSKSELKKLELGITVARISYNDTYEERCWRKDKIGKFIKQAHQLIEERLSTPFGENLYEGL